MSLRLRLTVLYSAILALTLIGFSIAIYATVARVTVGLLQDTLAGEAQRLGESSRFRLDSIDTPARKFAAPETYVQTRSFDGAVIDRTSNLEHDDVLLPLSAEGLQAVQQEQPWVEQATIEDRRLLIYSTVAHRAGQTIGIVQVARSMGEQDLALSTLQRILIISSSVVTLIACGIGWLLAGVALHPISRVTQTARAIGANRDFGQRVHYTGPDDEIGRLATTFNAMLSELQAAYRQAEQSLHAQRRFVADASHELRTPLTTLRGNLALLQRDLPISFEDREAILADMVDECERLMRLVNDLLVLARADAGRPLEIEAVPVKPLIEEVCRQVLRLDSGRVIDSAQVHDVVALGNRDALKQVVLIVLDNAIKYTPVTGAIRVTTALADEQVVIRIRDSGVGIDPAVLPHIFERFQRGDAARAGSGSGLGLAIAKSLIEAQRGTIAVESVLGRGSVVTLTLPHGTRRPVDVDVIEHASSH